MKAQEKTNHSKAQVYLDVAEDQFFTVKSVSRGFHCAPNCHFYEDARTTLRMPTKFRSYEDMLGCIPVNDTNIHKYAVQLEYPPIRAGGRRMTGGWCSRSHGVGGFGSAEWWKEEEEKERKERERKEREERETREREEREARVKQAADFNNARAETTKKWDDVNSMLRKAVDKAHEPCAFCEYTEKYHKGNCDDCPAYHLCKGFSSPYEDVVEAIENAEEESGDLCDSVSNLTKGE